VGRSFDGVKLSHKGESYTGDIFCLKVVERGFRNPPEHEDWKLYGIYGTFMRDRLDVFILYDLDLSKTGDNYDLARYTIGSYFKNNLESGLPTLRTTSSRGWNMNSMPLCRAGMRAIPTFPHIWRPAMFITAWIRN